MLPSFILPALAVLSFASTSAAQTACNASHFPSLACLTSHNGAASICSSAPRQTTTLTVTTTTLDINTQTITAHATSQTTVNQTTTEWSTITITSGPVKTLTTVETALRTESTTLMTYIPNAQVAAVIDPTCNPSNAISALGALPSNALGAICSCIGHRIPIRTITTTVTAPPVRTRTTDFAGTAPTTTLYEIVRHTTTVTERPMSYITVTTDICITSTKTKSYAAPAFTQVYGPKDGCEDTAPAQVKSLGVSIRTLDDAAQQCRDLCTQDPSCSSVYIQRLSTKRAGMPYFQCFFNGQRFDATSDLECGKATGIFGIAIGYDACDRGTEEL